jgi:hypothetical protein
MAANVTVISYREVAVVILGLCVLALVFALANHRSADRGRWRIWKQIGCLALSATSGSMFL